VLRQFEFWDVFISLLRIYEHISGTSFTVFHQTEKIMQLSAPNAPKFAGLQLIQVHGDNSPFANHYSLRFVNYTPPDQVDLFNDKAWGNHSPGPNGTVIDNPTARYRSREVERLSEKIARGEIPSQQEARDVVTAAINQAPVADSIKSKFRNALGKALFKVKVTHRVWDSFRFLITGYYGPNGKLVSTFGNEDYRDRLPENWEPQRLNQFSPTSRKLDNVYVGFELPPDYQAMGFTQPQD
jgi:hypothetical protein